MSGEVRALHLPSFSPLGAILHTLSSHSYCSWLKQGRRQSDVQVGEALNRADWELSVQHLQPQELLIPSSPCPGLAAWPR